MSKENKKDALTSDQIEWLRIDRDQTKRQLSDSLEREASLAVDARTLQEENAVYHEIALSNMAKARKAESFITGVWLEAKELSQGGLDCLTLGDLGSSGAIRGGSSPPFRMLLIFHGLEKICR